MKKRTIHVFPILLVFLLLLVGCQDSGQEPRAEWDREAGILTVDGVRYRKDEALVSIGDGLHRWRYEQSVTEQIASAGERGGQETYLVFANGTERRLLYGRGDGFSFGPLSYEVWFREDLLDELSGPLTEEEVSCGALTDAQLTQLLALYESTEREGSLTYEDAQAEARALELESHRLWRWLELPHRELPGLTAHIGFYFSARTGAPYLRCLDGALRPCPAELTDALNLSPALPQILSVTEDAPGSVFCWMRCTPCPRQRGSPGMSFSALLQQTSLRKRWSFALISTVRRRTAGLSKFCAAVTTPRPGPPICCFRTDSFARFRKMPRTAWGFQITASNRR